MLEQSKNNGFKETLLPTLGLFTSLGTLVCCALPALFVTLGAGAALASLVSNAPWLIALSKYKIWTFGISGVIILFAGTMRWKFRHAPCPIDPAKAGACMRLRRLNFWIYWLSVAIWIVGFFFAFVAVHVFF